MAGRLYLPPALWAKWSAMADLIAASGTDEGLTEQQLHEFGKLADLLAEVGDYYATEVPA